MDPLRPHLHPGAFAFVALPPGTSLADVAHLDVVATVREPEGLTVVLPEAQARAHGHPIAFLAAWITLDLPTALDAVGLTARFSAVLAAHGISCNVVAGVHHDHLFVPVERGEDAARVLETLSWYPDEGASSHGSEGAQPS